MVTPILRNTYRFNILISIGLSILIAYGWIGLREQTESARTKRVLAYLIPLLLFAEYAASGVPFVDLNISPFYTEFLEDVDDEVVLTIFPTTRQSDKYYLYLQTLHGHKMTNGVISRPEKDTFSFIDSNSMLETRYRPNEHPFPPDDALTAIDELNEIGVGYLIFQKEFLSEEVQTAWREIILDDPIFEDDRVFAYKLDG